jgi:uncharacterized protein DUF4124
MGLRAFLLLALAAASPMAPAAVLYKSVDANGVVMFSDTPPPDGARVLEERPLPSGPSSPGAPVEYAQVPGLIPAEQMLDYDAVISRANAQVDQAESALALARREVGAADSFGLRLRATRLASEDDARLETYRNNVKVARRQLMELLRERRLALRQ